MSTDSEYSRVSDVPSYFGSDLEAMHEARNYHRWIVSEFQPYLGKRVAEVGAGIGNFTEHLLAAGVSDITGFEPDRRMFAQLTARFAADARVQPSASYFTDGADGRYDSVVYVNVMEHVRHDRAELEAVRSALSAEGHLLIFVPALPWLYSRFDRLVGHERRYRLSDVEQLLHSCGYQIVRARYFDIAGILPWFILFTLLQRTLRPRSVRTYDRFVVPIMRRLEQRFTPPIGKNILVIAKPRQQAE